jgi:hypothetical protein
MKILSLHAHCVMLQPCYVSNAIAVGWSKDSPRDSSVGIATGYGLDGLGSVPGMARFFSSPWLWGPLSLLSNVCSGRFPRGLSGRGVKLTTHLHQLPRSRMVELYFHPPIRAGRRGFSSRHGKIVLFSMALGPTQPPIHCVQWAISPGVKRPGREADHSPPSIAEGKNGGAILPPSHTS